jgi:hypothetical protein
LTTCSGSAELSAISAFWPPVSAIRVAIGPASRAASARLMRRAVSVEPVKHTPATRGSRVSARADGGAVARHELQHVLPGSRPRAAAGCGMADQVGLFGRLGDHAVAGGQRGGDLAHEDRQREVPRADADEHAAPVQLQLVGFAGRAGQRFGAKCSRACSA